MFDALNSLIMNVSAKGIKYADINQEEFLDNTSLVIKIYREWFIFLKKTDN
ncbi:MAG: hypothetical protein GY699_04545 [Desulfobacteraceae bacterium]|nr:hypothetical protein [Desulfobacteraceae bacterium]